MSDELETQIEHTAQIFAAYQRLRYAAVRVAEDTSIEAVMALRAVLQTPSDIERDVNWIERAAKFEVRARVAEHELAELRGRMVETLSVDEKNAFFVALAEKIAEKVRHDWKEHR